MRYLFFACLIALEALVLVFLVAALISSVSACGRKARLEHLPEDKEQKIYPTR